MKIIFLDFDGVLNSTPFLTREGWYEAPLTQREHKFLIKHQNSNVDVMDLRMIDRSKVDLLNQLVEMTGAQVVISSSWRLGRSVQDLFDALDFHGFIGHVIGMTPELSHACRGDEIWKWLDVHVGRPDDCEFVILDDDADMGDLCGNLVQTSMKTGLTQYDVNKAIEVLKINDN